MPKYIIERDVPGAGNMTPEELQAISQTSVSVVAVMGRPYKWIESYVTADKVYCVHEAEDEDMIREHASCAGLPVNRIEEVKAVINPSTAE